MPKTKSMGDSGISENVTEPPNQQRRTNAQQAFASEKASAMLTPASLPRGWSKSLNFVPELHDPQSGRLDAKKISEMFQITLTEIARLVGKELSTLSKTPDAPSIQSGLAIFEQIAGPLLYLVQTHEHLRMWMNAPNWELEGGTPLAVLKSGNGEVVAHLLNDVVVGQPS